jgi:hypothetical protein
MEASMPTSSRCAVKVNEVYQHRAVCYTEWLVDADAVAGATTTATNPTAAEALNSLFSASILHSTRGDSAMEVDVVQLPLNVGTSEAINP